MISDEKRREVARTLRAIDGCIKNWIGVDVRWYISKAAFGDEYLHSQHDLLDRLADLIEPQPITGDTSDGYHTFDELYDHRAKLFSVIVRCFKDRAWKSKLHHDGTMYDGMFIVGIETPDGQATYHYDVDPYWGIFDCEVLDRAPEWDGHTPRQAIDRIAALGPSCDRDALLAQVEELERCAWYFGLDFDVDEPLRDRLKEASEDFAGCARSIREALGVTADADA